MVPTHLRVVTVSFREDGRPEGIFTCEILDAMSRNEMGKEEAVQMVGLFLEVG